jgi:hypothetical protein
MRELQEGISKLFEDVVSWDISLSNRMYDDPMLSIAGNNAAYQKLVKDSYNLVLEFRFPIQEFFRATFRRSPEDPMWMEELYIEQYRPHQMQRQQDYYGNYIVRVEYRITDLDHFLDILKEESWRRYDQRMNHLIDKVIDDRDQG